MSSTQVTESNRSLILCIRLIKVKLLNTLLKNCNYKLVIKTGTQTWSTTTKPLQHQSIKFAENHSFNLSDECLLHISLLEHKVLFKSEEIASVCLKLDLENKRITDWFDMLKSGISVGKVLISLFIDEKNEPFNKFKILNELDLEKEEIRFFKAKYLEKLKELKRVRKEFRKNTFNVLSVLEESFGGVKWEIAVA